MLVQVFVGDNSHTLSGWMAGAGIEYALTDNWSAKIEYDLIGLSVKTIETHRATAMRKLNVTSTAAIVRYAIRNQFIEP
jgi:opacity protein-like surface antigen